MAAITGRFLILVGDKSTHGGVIITGDPIATVNGIPVARIGDLHVCPQFWPKRSWHGITRISATGCPASRGLSKGKPQALSKDMVGCGAMVLPSQGLGASDC